ncbi:hypothetical protein ACKGJY_15075 [Hyunsoonleella sp. 2307UL5-6]|uniref:hypothetical protein n=1 Tax=Hyunsoonleella sp. 2307UL5-6 TaxID=3384768 RepID=UPI0039BD3C94
MSGQETWTRFVLDKKSLETIIDHNMNLGARFKPYPYKFRFLHIIKWRFLILKHSVINFDKPLKRFLTGGFGILFLAVLGLFSVNELKSCSNKKNDGNKTPTNDQTPSLQELNKSIEKDSSVNYQLDSYQDSINNERSNLNTDI